VAPTGEISTVSRPVPREQWRVTIPDHHPGYITWDRFLANRHRLEANKTNGEVIGGPAREGLCLLQGLLVCGSCGRRLTVRYTGNGGLYPTYECNHARREALTRQACVTTRATPVDAAICERVLQAVTPVTIELALKALTSLEEHDQAIAAQWHRRIERARYEADLAERRYEVVDPANRLVAATLESRWNDALKRVTELEAELASFSCYCRSAGKAAQPRRSSLRCRRSGRMPCAIRRTSLPGSGNWPSIAMTMRSRRALTAKA
jgi:hypothetical protein